MNTAAETHYRPEATAIAVLGALSFCHFLNDMMQSLLPAMYPMLKTGLALDFGQIGLITLVYQVTASLFQPLVGLYTDKRPLPYALACGMGFTLVGLLLLSKAASFPMLLVAAAGGRWAVAGRMFVIALVMLFGGFAGRGFLRSWCIGCLAVVLWYERLRR